MQTNTARRSMPKVLVTGGECRIALAAVRAIGRAGIPAAVIASAPHAITFTSRYCTQKILTPPDHHKEDYVGFLTQLVQRQKFACLLFCDDLPALHVGEFRDRLLPYVPFLLPPQPWIELSMNKSKMVAFGLDHGIPVPEVMNPKDSSEMRTFARRVGFPLLVKSNAGDSAKGICIVHSEDQLEQAFTDACASELQKNIIDLPIVQQFVHGVSYSVLALCDQGALLTFVMMRKIRTFPRWGGNCVEGETVFDVGLLQAVHQFLSNIPWTGILEVEFIQDAHDGRFKLIEFGPDFNWMLDLAVSSGVNFPLLVYQWMNGVRVPVVSEPCYCVGARFVWFFPEGIRYLYDRPASIPKLLLTLFDPHIKTDFFLSDPRALLEQVRQARWGFKKKRAIGFS